MTRRTTDGGVEVDDCRTCGQETIYVERRCCSDCQVDLQLALVPGTTYRHEMAESRVAQVIGDAVGGGDDVSQLAVGIVEQLDMAGVLADRWISGDRGDTTPWREQAGRVVAPALQEFLGDLSDGLDGGVDALAADIAEQLDNDGLIRDRVAPGGGS